MRHRNTPVTMYAVTTVMNSDCRTIQTTITPMEYDPLYHIDCPTTTQLIPYANGCVGRVEYYHSFNDMIRALRGEEIKRHRIAHALIGLIEALAGVA